MTAHVERDLLAAHIAAHVERCNLDELRVLGAFLRRMEVARMGAGPIDLDAPDWDREVGAELLDVVLYNLAARLSCERRECAEAKR